jgi:hypothetical protein
MTTWPSTLKLDLNANNWRDWDCQLEDTLAMASGSLYRYPVGLEPIPDAAIEPRTHRNWIDNDHAILHCIKTNCSNTEHDLLDGFKTCQAAYSFLSQCHQKQGIFPQILLLQEALGVRYSHAIPYSDTTNQLRSIKDRIVAMGCMTDDHLFCVLILNAHSSPDLSALRDQIHLLSTQATATLTTDAVEKLLQSVQTMRRIDNGPVVLPAAAMVPPLLFLGLVVRLPPRAIAVLCAPTAKSTSTYRLFVLHLVVAWKASLSTQRVSKGLPSTPAAASSTASSRTLTGLPITMASGQTAFVSEGVLYSPVAIPAPNPATPVQGGDFAGLLTDHLPPHLMSAGDVYEHSAWIVTPDEHIASVNWAANSRPLGSVSLGNTTAIDSTIRIPLSLDKHSFFFDTGATTHLLPERTNFLELRHILPRPITGIGGTKVCAIGIGMIHLSVSRGTHLSLEDVLYVPLAMVC